MALRNYSDASIEMQHTPLPVLDNHKRAAFQHITILLDKIRFVVRFRIIGNIDAQIMQGRIIAIADRPFIAAHKKCQSQFFIRCASG